MKSVFISFFLILQFSTVFAGENYCADQLKTIKEKVFGREVEKYSSTGDAFTAGLKEADQLITVANAIRTAYAGKSRSDVSVHVEALIPIAKNLLEFAERDLKSLPFWERKGVKEVVLAKLKEEFEKRIVYQNVTYHWLFVTSFRVAILVDRGYSVQYIWTDWKDLKKETTWHSYEGASEVLKRFSTAQLAFQAFERQDLIALPTLGDLGLFAINKMTTAGLAPLGHSSGKIIIDDQPMFSFSFWAHDASHLYGYQSLNPQFLFYSEKFFQLLDSLPLKKRQMVEFYFFFTTHERPIILENPHISVTELEKVLSGPSMLFYNSISPTFYGSSLKAAGVDILNHDAVKAWLAEGQKEFLILHQQVLEKEFLFF